MIEVRLSVVLYADDDRAADAVLRALRAAEGPSCNVHVRETQRELVREEADR